MLVLSRKSGEEIVIDLNGVAVAIQILKINGSRVCLGVEAPNDVAVHRRELWDDLVEAARLRGKEFVDHRGSWP